ncbi:unnamed protein product, partial [marine sediment metagenome]
MEWKMLNKPGKTALLKTIIIILALIIIVNATLLSEDKDYTYDCYSSGSTNCPHTSYPDTDGIELTDGLYGLGETGVNWVGFSGNPDLFVNVTINFSESKTVNAVNTTYLNATGSILQPISVTYFCGDESYNFVSLGSGVEVGISDKITMFP